MVSSTNAISRGLGVVGAIGWRPGKVRVETILPFLLCPLVSSEVNQSVQGRDSEAPRFPWKAVSIDLDAPNHAPH